MSDKIERGQGELSLFIENGQIKFHYDCQLFEIAIPLTADQAVAMATELQRLAKENTQ